MTADGLSGRVARLAAALEQWPRRTVRLDELWQLWAQADPASAGRPERRGDLAYALAILADARLVTLSRTVDRSAAPPLPTVVTLPTTAPGPSATVLARQTAWRPELAWATGAQLTIRQVTTLQTINTWLRDRGRDHDVVPLRERSLEILGHEKALDGMVNTSLFATGRLSLDLLRTFRAHPPLPSVQLGPGQTLLVVENEDTFSSLLTALRRDPSDIGRLAWGAGGAFEASVRSVADLDPPVTEIRYFGDLDYAGLRIPANTAATALAEGLPAVLPAAELYTRLLEVGKPQLGQPVPDDSSLNTAVAWLHSSPDTVQVATAAEHLLRTGARIPQEALGLRQLTAD